MSEAPRYSFTRAELIEALTRIQVRPVDGKVVADWMADALLETLAEIAEAKVRVEIIHLESWRSEIWNDDVPSRPGWQVKCSECGHVRSPQWRHDWAYETETIARMVATRHRRSKHGGA